ncbi:histidine phosphatase family protein [Paraburkholderia mimosarum]|uniref:histidine phosphatase family protein n=1 Tax=Paraburkholderia mimosarum TaxID=312026 RepID=UPI00048415BC
MSARVSLRLVAHASTRAMRAGRFPDDDPLDKRGLAEAVAARDQWAAVLDPVVLCSSAQCALQTAAAFGLCAEVDPALRDVDYKDWRGESLSDVARDTPGALRAWMDDPSAAPHGGESFEDVISRVGIWLDRLPSQRTIVAVTHAVVVRAAIVQVLRAEPKAMSRIEVAPLSFAEFKPSLGGWKLLIGSGDFPAAIHRN